MSSHVSLTALPDKTSAALDAVERADKTRFPYNFADHVLKHEPRLLQAFLDLLGTDVEDAQVTERLTEFHGRHGGGRRPASAIAESARRTHGGAKAAPQERRAVEKAQIAAVNQRPQDEATIDESNQLKRERDKKLELVKEINQRELLNTLTDAGLIPNYAFPEAGIELKSVLWRRKAADNGAMVTM